MGLRSEQRRHIDTVLASTDQAGAGASLPVPSEVIRRSWQRCIEQYGLDPRRPKPARIVTSQTLREHRDQVDEFLDVARAGVEQLYAHIAELDYVLLLCDRRGIAVEYLGSRARECDYRRAGLYLGSDWNERYAGTCGVGTCIEENRALTCHHVDHFDANHIDLTCTAAPIFAPDGDLLAVLDASALHSPKSPDSQNFALQLVSLYARMIENAYFLRRYRDAYVVRFDASRELVQVNGQYMMAMEEDGTLIAANTLAREFLASHPAHYAESPLAYALSVTDLFDCELADVWSIPYATDDQVRAFRTHSGNEIYFATLVEPKKRGSPAHFTRNVPQTEYLPDLDDLGADDPSMRKSIACAKRLRDERVNLLIVGQTGTGKERLARAIHEASNRAVQPFVAVNCAAIPESLIESELFGYRPGTFTGARSRGMKGLIQQSNGGTLFLDEIGDMPLHLQTRLLRVLAEQEILPLGAERPLPVNLRVIAATHRDLRQLLNEGSFREDLYYRLNGATLRLPPLRERADKQYVIRRVFDAMCRQRGRHTLIRGDAMSALLAYAWPGNIRELNNAFNFALATCEDEEIKASDLPDECLPQPSERPLPPPLEPPRVVPSVYTSEAQQLQALLREHRWNVTAVAGELRVSRPTVYRRMRRHGIVPPNLRG